MVNSLAKANSPAFRLNLEAGELAFMSVFQCA